MSNKIINIKPIAGYEGRYSITEHGKIWAHRRETTYWMHINGTRVKTTRVLRDKFLRPAALCSGYLRVVLTDNNGKSKSHSVHRLVAQAFIPNPENKPQVNHIDFDPRNNKKDNLGWATAKENVNHSYFNLHDLRDDNGWFRKKE